MDGASVDDVRKYVKISVKGAVASRFSRLIEQHPDLGFDSLADFMVRASIAEAERLEDRFRGGSASSSPPSPPPAPVAVPSAGPEVPPADDKASTPRRRAKKDDVPEPPAAPSPAVLEGGRSPSPAAVEPPGGERESGARKQGRNEAASQSAENLVTDKLVQNAAANPAAAPVAGEAQGTGSAAAPPISTRRCNACGRWIPLTDWPWHKPDCPGRPAEPSTPQPSSAVTPEPSPTAKDERRGPAPPTPTAPKDSIVITRLEARVREESFRRLVRDKGMDPIAGLAVVVQRAYVDSGFREPSDVIAQDLVKAFRLKSDPLDAALDRLEEPATAASRPRKGAVA